MHELCRPEKSGGWQGYSAFCMKYLTLAVFLLPACPPAFAQGPGSVPAMPLTAAVRALGNLRAEAAVPVLMEKFLDEKEKTGIRLQALDALANYPKDGVFNLFVKALNDEDARIKNQALVSLYNGFAWDRARTLPYIQKMASDGDVGDRAAQYLKNMGAGK